MNDNYSLHKAQVKKDDEFYTQLKDIENELVHYKEHFKDKVVYCNCDNPTWSAFWEYFYKNFTTLKLKKLIATNYSTSKPVYKTVYEGEDVIQITQLQGSGDFRSKECIDILNTSDIVVTNPPFSLFREYVSILMKYNKKFLVIGNHNAITYKNIFPLIQNHKLWLGNNYGDMAFKVPNDSEPRKTRFWIDEDGQKWRSMGNICWFTNLDHDKHHKKLYLYKKYSVDEYPKYDNYDAIEVSKVAEIPIDYDGVMGVPVTFMAKYNPEQFDIVGVSVKGFNKNIPQWDGVKADGVIDGKVKYKRIFIKKK